jgi:tRNA(Ile)-lysidine synthase
VTAVEFAAAMAAIGGFERAPRVAVAVSGGPDSLALTLLADGWARARGGAVLALTVDHGLRPESGAEAEHTRAVLAGRGIDTRILALDWTRPQRALQAAARAARYRRLEDQCRAAGLLHLLTGHQREDQAETFLLRLGRGSGVDGLAAMAPVTYRSGLRLLRPLLEIARDRLAATCAAFGEPWIEDPSNRNPRAARAHLRASLPALGEDGLTVARLAATAAHLARARAALGADAARLMAGAVRLDPAGFARLERAALAAAPGETGRRVLAALLATVAGAELRPRFERLDRLYRRLVEVEGPVDATLGGCRIVADRFGVTVAREAAALAAPVPLEPGRPTRWDGRFSVMAEAGTGEGLTLGALGKDAGSVARAARGGQAASRFARAWRRIPPVARPTLPCIRGLDAVLHVPHLTYCREGGGTDTLSLSEFVFDPALPLSGPDVECRM